jgi:hypothetical protein
MENEEYYRDADGHWRLKNMKRARKIRRVYKNLNFKTYL